MRITSKLKDKEQSKQIKNKTKQKTRHTRGQEERKHLWLAEWFK
jgi:hypothetical protein